VNVAQPPRLTGSSWCRRQKGLKTVIYDAYQTYADAILPIDQVMVGGRNVAVTEEVTSTKPFCTLLHFKKSIAVEQPRLLVAAPMSVARHGSVPC
jgi:poly-beta-hydroxyalkanoate depolymerase